VESQASANKDSAVSLGSEPNLLQHREAALRGAGYDVFSTTSPMRAQFEVEMGRCDLLLLCYTLHQRVHSDLAEMFKHRCPTGVLVCIMHPTRRTPFPHAQICLLDSDFPTDLHLIRKARKRPAFAPLRPVARRGQKGARVSLQGSLATSDTKDDASALGAVGGQRPCSFYVVLDSEQSGESDFAADGKT
jgi:hypothetical protein